MTNERIAHVAEALASEWKMGGHYQMKRLATALFGLIIASLICGIAIAQPPSQAAVGGEEQSSAGPARHDPMTGEGMGMCRMGRGGMPGMMGMMPLMIKNCRAPSKRSRLLSARQPTSGRGCDFLRAGRDVRDTLRQARMGARDGHVSISK
jgi:hypothetical protein